MRDKSNNAVGEKESSIGITLEDKLKERDIHRKRILNRERDKEKKINSKNKTAKRKMSEYKREKDFRNFY